MNIAKSVVWMLVLGFATSEGWAQHTEHSTVRVTPPEGVSNAE